MVRCMKPTTLVPLMPQRSTTIPITAIIILKELAHTTVRQNLITLMLWNKSMIIILIQELSMRPRMVYTRRTRMMVSRPY